MTLPELPYDPDPDSLLLRSLKGDVEAYRRVRARQIRDAARERRQLGQAIARDTILQRLDSMTAAAPRPPAVPLLDVERIETICRDYPDAITNALAPSILDVIEAWDAQGE